MARGPVVVVVVVEVSEGTVETSPGSSAVVSGRR